MPIRCFSLRPTCHPRLATPSATGGAAAGTPQLGDEVAYIKATGGTIATLTVTKRVRPWTEFNDSDTPDSGSDDVAFEIQITPLGSRGDLILKPDAFRRPDADGFLRAVLGVAPAFHPALKTPAGSANPDKLNRGDK